MIDGKARTWRQWQQLQEKEKVVQVEKEEKAKFGRCAICAKGAFTLSLVNRELVRTCKNCADSIVV